MDPSIEELLLAKVISDNKQQEADLPTERATRNLGAILGGVGGTLAPSGGIGSRMAGGLVGAIVGGQLGPAIRKMAIQESEAGPLLAKIQAQGGEVSATDKAAIQSFLADHYSKMGIA